MVVLGRVIGPHGIRGQVKVTPFTECIDGLTGYTEWWLSGDEKNWRVVHPVLSSGHNSELVVSLSEYKDRTGASELKGLLVAVPRSQLPQLSEDGEDGYYWADLIGMDVVNAQNELLGTAVGLFETGANDVLRIQPPEGNKEALIPFVNHVIIRVDLKLRKITVDWELDY